MTDATSPAPAAPSGVVPPVPSGAPARSFVRRAYGRAVGHVRTWWKSWPGPFSRVPVDTTDPSGLLSPRGRWEWAAAVGGLGVGLWVGLFMVLFYFSHAPIPPGGDPGEWIAGSYQFIGQPFPSWYASSDSPPLMFPLLGMLVVVGGGPIPAARLFVIVQATLLGGSAYVLGRSLTRHPVTALGIEAFYMLNPTLDSLFFTGAYQYLFSFVFLNLTVAYAIRFVRSRRNFHLAAFWLSATAAVFSHPAMIAEVPGIIALMGVVFLWMRQLPKEMITTWTGRVGAALFGGVSITWYFLVPRLLGLHQNSFLLKNGYFTVIQHTIGVVFATLVDPFFQKWSMLPGPTIETFELLLAAGGLGYLALRFLRPKWLTPPWVGVLSLALAQIVFALVGYKFEIVTPYVRFGELLIFPVIAAIAMGIEGTIAWASTVVENPDPPSPAKPRRHRVLWRRIRTSPRWSLVIPSLLCVGVLVVLGVYVDQEVTPAFERFETTGTNVGHNDSFLAMLGYINNCSISGSILTLAHATSWTRAITHRDVYAPFLPGYALNEPHILIDEEVGFSLDYRYAVTNDFVALTTTGYSTPYITALPGYEASYFGLFFPVLRMVPQSLIVNESGLLVPAFTRGSPSPSYILPGPGQSTLGMGLTARGVNLTIEATAIPGTDSGTITVTATATGTLNLTGLSVNLAPGLGLSAWYNETAAPGSFEWNPARLFPGYGYTTGTVTPANALRPLPAGRNASASSPTGINVSALPAGSIPGQPVVPSRSISFSITLTSPQSTNFVSQLPPFISASAVWNSLNAGLFMYEPAAVPRLVQRAVNPFQLSWLQNEFGMTLLWTNNDWQLYLLPAQAVGPP